MKKKLIWSLIFLLIVLLGVSLSHQTTIRYLDKYNASIATDRSTRLIKVPFVLQLSGYKLKSVTYSHSQHMFVSHYIPKENPLVAVKKAKYLGVTFQPTTVPIVNKSQMDPFILSRNYTGNNTGRDTLRILVGNSYNKYQVLSANYPAVSVRDPSIMKRGSRYYIIYTRGLLSTTDFNHWKKINWPPIPGYDYLQDWAPEFVEGPNNRIYIVMSICKKDAANHHLAVTTFSNGKIGKRWTKLTGNLPSNVIDPNIQYYKGKYYLFCKNEKIRKLVMGVSDQLNGPYKMSKIEFNSSKYGSIEGPEALVNKGKIKLAFDTYNTRKDGTTVFYGLHYVTRNSKNGKWSKIKEIYCPIVTRHGQFILNK